jgi:hypothetical protein
METIAINTLEAKFKVTVAGEEFVVDFTRMHPSWVSAHLRKAAQRFVNDGLTGMTQELPSVKADAARKAFAAIHSGEAMPEKIRKAPSVSKIDLVRKLAREKATTFLTARLVKQLGKDMKVWAAQPKLAKLFTFTDKGNARFDLAAVDEWMDGFKSTRDFMAEAADELAIDADESGLDDLGL